MRQFILLLSLLALCYGLCAGVIPMRHVTNSAFGLMTIVPEKR